MTENEVLAESIRNYLESGVDLLLTDDDYRTIIKALEQEPKTGHWIENAPEYQNIDPPYICSECGHAENIQTNFCSQCGLRMVEPQESEDKECI